MNGVPRNDWHFSFVEQMSQLIEATIARMLRTWNPFVRIGTITSDYTSGLPKVIFDGETEASGRRYPHLASYTPAANDRVLLIRSGSTWVILGKIKSS